MRHCTEPWYFIFIHSRPPHWNVIGHLLWIFYVQISLSHFPSVPLRMASGQRNQIQPQAKIDKWKKRETSKIRSRTPFFLLPVHHRRPTLCFFARWKKWYRRNTRIFPVSEIRYPVKRTFSSFTCEDISVLMTTSAISTKKKLPEDSELLRLRSGAP